MSSPCVKRADLAWGPTKPFCSLLLWNVKERVQASRCCVLRRQHQLGLSFGSCCMDRCEDGHGLCLMPHARIKELGSRRSWPGRSRRLPEFSGLDMMRNVRQFEHGSFVSCSETEGTAQLSSLEGSVEKLHGFEHSYRDASKNRMNAAKCVHAKAHHHFSA